MGRQAGGGELTAGSPAGGALLISMRFSGSSSSGASSGITTTGLMCSARAEARRKLGGPCRDSSGEMLSYLQKPSVDSARARKEPGAADCGEGEGHLG